MIKVAAFAALGLALLLEPRQTTFRSAVDAVQVDVLVTRNAVPVPNLTTADFELRDSGVRQHIDVVSLEQQTVSILFALDVSASMKGEPIARLKEAALAAIDVVDAKDQLALLTFSDVLKEQAGWSLDRGPLRHAVGAIEPEGWTSLQDAAFAALALRQHATGRVLVLLFSDGIDTVSWLDARRVLEFARRSDLVIDVVSLAPEHAPAGSSGESENRRATGGKARAEEHTGLATHEPPPPSGRARQLFLDEPVLFRTLFLPLLAEDTGGEVVSARRADLRDAFVRIVRAFKTRYVLSYVPQNVPSGGWHPLEVRLITGKADVRARRGYER